MQQFNQKLYFFNISLTAFVFSQRFIFKRYYTSTRQRIFQSENITRSVSET